MTTSSLLDRESWERTGKNLIERAPYAIQRLTTTKGTKYLLWRELISNGRSYVAVLGSFDSADRAREAASADQSGGE